MATEEQIISQLLDRTSPVAVRMRSIFSLKALATAQAVQALEKSLVTDPSALMRHEVAYVLGQMRSTQSLPTLTKVLQNAAEDVIVRHEAAEAMGAIADHSVLPLLQRYAQDQSLALEIRETCVLALNRIRWYQHQPTHPQSSYTSVDPAPPHQRKDIAQLQKLLCDASNPIFERYKAMFALRNIGGEQAVLALCAGMHAEKESALFRHEVAYVLGQMQHSASVPTLARFLKDHKEHEMVRHEAAEALGSIASPQAEQILAQFRADKKDVVRESVQVALDISEYTSGDQLHYAQVINERSDIVSLQATR